MTKEKGDSVLNTRYCQVRSGVGPWPPAWSPDDLCDWPFFSPPRSFFDACALVTCQKPADLPPCRQRGLKRERISAAESLCCQSRISVFCVRETTLQSGQTRQTDEKANAFQITESGSPTSCSLCSCFCGFILSESANSKEQIHNYTDMARSKFITILTRNKFTFLTWRFRSSVIMSPVCRAPSFLFVCSLYRHEARLYGRHLKKLG